MTNRRNFLKASFSAAGAAVAGSAGLCRQGSSKWDESFDFVIIGAGGAGTKRRPVMLQKLVLKCWFSKKSLVGGSSLICGGAWSVGGTELQKSKGIEDSEEKFFADMMKTGQNENDPALVRAFVRASKEEYEWILSKGVKPSTVAIASGMSVPRAHRFDPAAVIAFYLNYAKKLGVDIRLNTPADRLVWDADAGRTAGVRVRNAKQRLLLLPAKVC